MGLRKLFLTTLVNLQVGKIVIKGNYVEVFVYHLPVEFKTLIEEISPRAETIIFNDEKLENVCEKLGLNISLEGASVEDIREGACYYKCLPNKVFSIGSMINLPDKISVETKENILIENISPSKMWKSEHNIKFDRSMLNKDIKKGCLVELYCMRHNGECEYNFKPLPIRKFDQRSIRFDIDTYEILSPNFSYHFFGDVKFSDGCSVPRNSKKTLVSKGTIKYHDDFDYDIEGKWVVMSEV